MQRAVALTILMALPLGSPARAATPKRKPAKTAAPVKIPPAPPLYPTRSTQPIVFIWPPEGLSLAASNEFIFGSISPASAPFSINGTTVSVHRDGGFIAWLPIAPGTFTFRGELTLSSGTATAERRIQVPVPPSVLPADKLAIDPSSLSPKSDLELRAGDWLSVRMRAAPGKAARYRIGGGDWRVMRESPASAGVYESLRQIAPGEEFEAAPVEYELAQGWSSVKLKGKARVSSSMRISAVATVKTSTAGFANIKTGPANGFLSFPLPGTRLVVTGRENSSLRVRLSDSLSGWIEAKDVELSTPTPLRAVTGTIAIAKTSSGAAVSISLSDKVAFDVEPSAALDALTLRLYNTVGHTNWVLNEAPEFLKEIRWRQETTDTVAVTIILQPGASLWGWWPLHENGSLKLDIRRAPAVSLKNPLSGIKIMLDPGHMPSAVGAIGPLGTTEMDANYAIAMAAKAKLEREGAIVLLTRGDPAQEVSLAERPRLAVERSADLFVSLHNNAISDGENPFGKPRGFTVFYYHPQSLEFGRAVHAAFKERIKLADEGLRWGNLLVARQSAMPAILVENAYMMFPDQEAMLNDAAFRDELAKTLVEGLKNFLASAGKRR